LGALPWTTSGRDPLSQATSLVGPAYGCVELTYWEVDVAGRAVGPPIAGAPVPSARLIQFPETAAAIDRATTVAPAAIQSERRRGRIEPP
jgi:hypothetical protein